LTGSTPPSSSSRNPVAIVGFACRFPGARDSNGFWSLLRSGGYAIADLPPSRLDRGLYYSPDRGRLGKSYCTIGGVIEPVANDPELAVARFPLPEGTDEAHYHLAAVALAACREAGISLHGEQVRKAGIYLAHLRGSAVAAGLTYARSVEEFGESLRYSETFRGLTGLAQDSIVRSLIGEVRESFPPVWQGQGARHLHPTAALKLLHTLTGFGGPAVNVDAACASSFQALDLAVRAIRMGEMETALVASASYLNWHSLVLFSQAHALSEKGSFPFDRRADGFVSSDGYASLVIKSLAAAERDGDRIHGVIRGIGMSSDGAGRSLWAPCAEGQVAAIRRAWADGPNPARLQYVEAHGTSTQLGDATELDALTQALGTELAGRRVPIASVKANIGHARESAGLAGLIKCLLAIRHRAIPPAVNCETPNPEIPWDRIPFYVPGQLTEWTEPADGGPRIAAIDSFGIGGLNGHVILEEYLPGQACAPRPAPPAKVEGIAIVGVGCVLPGANSFDEFRRLMRSGADARQPVPEGRWPWVDPAARPLGGFVNFEYDWRRHKIPPKTLRCADPLQFMILDAADQAWLSAGFGADQRGGERAAVVVGTVFSGEFRNQLNLALHMPDFTARLARISAEAGVGGADRTHMTEEFERIFLDRSPALLDETGGFTSSTLASRLVRTYDLMGNAFAVDAGECSSLAALSAAAQMLRAGDCDLALCAAGQRSMDLISFELAERYRTNWSLAEGSVVLLLKRVADAKASGDRIYGILGEIGVERTTAVAPHDPIVHQLGHTFAAAGLVSLLNHIAQGSDGQIRISGDAGLTWSASIQCAPRAKHGLTQPRVAFLFGGQGAHYPDMLRGLIESNAAAAAALDECNGVFGTFGVPSFARLAWSPEARLGSDVRDTQLAALTADYVLYRAIRSMGVQPDLAAGYSFGDFAALVAVGSLSLRDAVAITLERCRLLEGVEGELVAIRASREEFEAAACPGIYLAIHSGPGQLIVGGSADAIGEFTRKAASLGWDPLPLAVPRPYHTPLMRTLCAEFRQVLDGFRFRPPMIPYLSTVDARYLADPRDLRDSLVRHLSEPVRYDESIRRIAAEESTFFVEIGPKQPLTQLHHRILTDPSAGLIHTDSPTHPMKQLEKVRDLVQPREAVRTMPLSNIAPASPVYFDATEKRRAKTAARAAAVPVLELRDEVEQFLVRFICERTGYPSEMVDMDADLEADLGIDSIKRAELLGEAREVYRLELRADEKLALSDFSTLRRIYRFIAERRRAEPAASAVCEPSPHLLELAGTPYDIGVQHARRYGDSILRALELYRRVPGNSEPSDAAASLGPVAFEQLTGIADTLRIPSARLAAFNLALCPEQLPGCAHFAVRTPQGILAGANEDAPLVLHLGDALRPLLQLNRPGGGIAHLFTGAAGKVGGINGLNARGLSVTSALLLDRFPSASSEGGMFHPALVQQVLSTCSGVDDALALLRHTRRSGAWSMILSEYRTGRICHLEYENGTLVAQDWQARAMASNHALLLAPGTPDEHSVCRLSRLRTLLEERELTLDRAQAILLDRYDPARRREGTFATMNTLCRLDHLSSFLVASKENAVYTASRGSDRFAPVPLNDLLEEAAPERTPTSRYVLSLHTAPVDASGVEVPRLVCVLGIEEKVRSVAAALRTRGAECSTCSGTAADQYFHTQQWLSGVLETGAEKQAAIVSVTSLGGDFGLAGNVADYESAGQSGLLKAIRYEFPEVRVKVIDTAPDDDPAPYVIAELSSADNRVEVSWSRGIRYVIQGEARPAQRGAGFQSAGAWVVTGGARGITARCADALAARFGVHLYLLGRTPAGTAEAQHPYYSCDVTDRDALARVLAEIRAQEPITGILHGAGVEYSAGFLRKQAAQVRETLAVKVAGARNLMELTANDPLRYFVAFGSAAGRFGGAGQTDYAMASEMLAKLTQKLRRDRPACRAVTFHWPAWDGVGMAMRPQTRILLEMANRRFMPVAEGVAHFIAELEAGVPEGEVLIFDGQSSRDADHSVREPAASTRRTLDAAKDLFLRDHCYRSEPLLPAAASLALLVHATGPGSGFLRVRDFVVAGPLRFAKSETKEVSIETERSADGFACRLRLSETGRVLAEALVASLDRAPVADFPCDLSEAAWKPYRYRSARESAAAGTLFYGKSMRCLKQIVGDANFLKARILAAPPGDGVIDPALLDACLVACGSWAVRRCKVRPLAHGFGQLDIGRRPAAGETCLLSAKFLGRSGGLLLFDFNLADSAGEMIYSAQRCSFIVTGERSDD